MGSAPSLLEAKEKSAKKVAIAENGPSAKKSAKVVVNHRASDMLELSVFFCTVALR